MQHALNHGGCPQATRIDDLCPACLEEWERWMEETAMPQLRQAIAREEAEHAEVAHAA